MDAERGGQGSLKSQTRETRAFRSAQCVVCTARYIVATSCCIVPSWHVPVLLCCSTTAVPVCTAPAASTASTWKLFFFLKSIAPTNASSASLCPPPLPWLVPVGNGGVKHATFHWMNQATRLPLTSLLCLCFLRYIRKHMNAPRQGADPCRIQFTFLTRRRSYDGSRLLLLEPDPPIKAKTRKARPPPAPSLE